jgi:hypothetical protein
MTRFAMLFLVLMFLAGPPAAAQGQPPERKVSINIKEMPLRSAVALLFQDTSFQFAIAPEVPNIRITLNIKDVPFDTALRTLIRLASPNVPGLTYQKDAGGVYVVSVRAESASASGTDMLLKIPLSFMRAEEFLARIDPQLLPTEMRAIQPLSVDNSLLVRGPAEAVERLKRIVRLMDIPPHMLSVRASVQGPGASGRPLNFQAAARTINGREVVIDEQTVVGGQTARLKVSVKAFVQGDGSIAADSDWDVSVPVNGGARGPIRLLKRLATSTRLRPGHGAALGEVDLAPWGGTGLVRLWLRIDLLPEPVGRNAYSTAGEDLGPVTLIDDVPYLSLWQLTDMGDLRFDAATGTYALLVRSGRPQPPLDIPGPGPFRLVIGSSPVSNRVRSFSAMRYDPAPYAPLADVATALGGKVRFDPATDAYRITGGRSLAALLGAGAGPAKLPPPPAPPGFGR